MSVLDASAVLAYLQDEDGAELVETHLTAGALISAANWSEVAQKTRSRGLDWSLVAALLDSHDLGVVEVNRADAELAAALWQDWPSLSLGDRLCLALAQRLQRPAVTADRAWGTKEGVVQIRGDS